MSIRRVSIPYISISVNACRYHLARGQLFFKELRNNYQLFLGTYLIIQVVDLFLIWGDIALMTGTAFLLFTNMAQAAKVINIVGRKKRIQAVVNDGNKVLSGVQGGQEREIVKRYFDSF